MDEIVVERGDEVERGEPLRLDERERPARAPVRLADEAAVHRGHARQRVDPHGVVERDDAEGALAPPVAALGHRGGRGAPPPPAASPGANPTPPGGASSPAKTRRPCHPRAASSMAAAVARSK